MAKNTAAPVTADPLPATRAYQVTSPLNHDQVDYAIGDTVELTDAQAAPLLDRAIALPATAATDATSDPGGNGEQTGA